MLDSLKAIKEPRQHQQYYSIGHDESGRKVIVITPGTSGQMKNLTDLIHSISFAQQELASSPQLSPDEHKLILTRLAVAAGKAQAAIEKKPFFVRILIKALEFLSTGTTLSSKIAFLQDGMEKSGLPAAETTFPSLMADAMRALTNQAEYAQVSRNYTVPEWANPQSSAMGKQDLNPLLYTLKQRFTSEWRAISDLLKEGKSLEDPKVARHVDCSLQMARTFVELALKYELVPKAPGNKVQLGRALANQNNYACWLVNSAGIFYNWLRDVPVYNFSDKRWYPSYNDHPELNQKFYQENTRPDAWRNSFNEICRLVSSTVDIQTLFEVEDRFIPLVSEDDGKRAFGQGKIVSGTDTRLQRDLMRADLW